MENNAPIFQYRFTFKRIILFPILFVLSGAGLFLVFFGQSDFEKLSGIGSFFLVCLSFSDRIEIPHIFSSKPNIIHFNEIHSVSLEARKYPPAGIRIDHGTHTWINPDFILKEDRDALMNYFKSIGKVKNTSRARNPLT